MKSRPNPNQSLKGRFFPIHPVTPLQPRDCARGSKPSSHSTHFSAFVAQPGIVETAPPEPKLVLEDEISTDELNRFALSCIEHLASSGKEQPIEVLISQAIKKNLPSYAALKTEFLSTRHEHRSQHQWTKQLVDVVEPLLKSKSAPVSEQEELSDLALKSVEKTMQMQYRVDRLGQRVEFLNREVSRHLVQIGLEIGFPDALMQKLARLTQSVLEQY